MSLSMMRFIFFRIYLFISFLHMGMFLVAFIREHIWHKALLIGYSMRFTHVCSLNGFLLVMGLYRGHTSLFLRV